MDRETIIKLAREAGIVFDDAAAPFYERFAKMVAEHVIKDAPDYKMGYADGVAVEREACAKVVNDDRGLSDDDAIRVMRAIRAMGNT